MFPRLLQPPKTSFFLLGMRGVGKSTWARQHFAKARSAGVSLLSCEADVRVGGSYRLVFSFQGSEMAFFGTYREVTPHSRLVWTNDEAGDAGQVTTVTFEEKAGKTLVVLHELYPSKEALDAALASGSQDGTLETFEQLDEFVVTLAASVGR